MPEVYPIVYQNPLEAIGTAQRARLAHQGKLPNSLKFAGKYARRGVRDDIADADEIIAIAAVAGPFCPGNDMA